VKNNSVNGLLVESSSKDSAYIIETFTVDTIMDLNVSYKRKLLTIKTHKWQSKHNRFIIIYYFRATCFDYNLRVIIGAL